ncbi:MarR family winged helix-turn-helix transcriptional regulator [Sediminicola luteus]|uniref:MarR family transcriptional regulator n=1 Tax=Sediminicola luteus TaxID=319238 RepID=A0A2A4G7F8_9FLAO|nr:MarR family winged helix-turn-helix transcriptional regulator [Sediminicola luteus]PCE64909.1 MarR family transcriptional regulator [Sediminicola luteus]
MALSSFDPNLQQQDLSSKIVAGFERISEVFKVLLWNQAKLEGLSPIQIQILIFSAYHKAELCTVSYLAQEFNVTKPTISDAIRVLLKKELLIKGESTTDNRSYHILLTEIGQNTLERIQLFEAPFKPLIANLPPKEQYQLFSTLSTLIHQLNSSGILQVQRHCLGCRHYSKKGESHYCNLLNKSLTATELRLDCPEHSLSS